MSSFRRVSWLRLLPPPTPAPRRATPSPARTAPRSCSRTGTGPKSPRLHPQSGSKSTPTARPSSRTASASFPRTPTLRIGFRTATSPSLTRQFKALKGCPASAPRLRWPTRRRGLIISKARSPPRCPRSRPLATSWRRSLGTSSYCPRKTRTRPATTRRSPRSSSWLLPAMLPGSRP